jgi:hypothetical protein
MARQVTKRINGGTKTVAAVFSEPDEQWTPDWDKFAAGQQAMARNEKRAKMGDKLTPLGPGKLMKPKR